MRSITAVILLLSADGIRSFIAPRAVVRVAAPRSRAVHKAHVAMSADFSDAGGLQIRHPPGDVQLDRTVLDRYGGPLR